VCVRVCVYIVHLQTAIMLVDGGCAQYGQPRKRTGKATHKTVLLILPNVLSIFFRAAMNAATACVCACAGHAAVWC